MCLNPLVLLRFLWPHPLSEGVKVHPLEGGGVWVVRDSHLLRFEIAAIGILRFGHLRPAPMRLLI